MKHHLITLISCIGIIGTSIYGQSSSGGGGGAGGSGSSGGSAGASAGASGAANVRAPNAVHGPFSPVQTAPSAPQTGQNPSQVTPGSTPGAGLNATVGANGFATNSANVVPQPGFGTNQATALGGTNSMGGARDFDNDNDRDRFGSSSNRFGGFTNRFGGFTNSFRTNGLVFDQFTTPQDQALAHQIRQAILPEIRETHAPIHLVVNNGVVTLVGFVPSLEERGEIENLVQRTPGVVNVVDNLQIGRDFERGERGTSRFGFENEDRWDNDRDRDLIGHARREMRRHNRFTGEDESVHIISRNGVVTLVGFVATTQEEQAFVNAVQNTPGVVQVINNIQIQGQEGANGNATVGATIGTNGVTASGGLGPNRAGQLGGVNGIGIPNSRFGVGTNLTPTSRENSPSRFFPGPTNSMNGTNMAPR